ncbi:MFS transporter [Lentzea sp. NPDC059081]|uniref:MFS transporter n=1 Tax=Lentzea sp. NPDC059081 TaxID=3346719 RepID=UPI0036C58DE4
MSAWGIRDFRLLWGGRAVSSLGSWLLVVAVPAHVYALTGSVFATGLALAAEYLPAVVLGPVAGVLVDRWDRRRVMIAADLVRAAAVAVMLLGTPAAIYAAVVAESVGAVLFRPAAQAHVPAVVGTGPALAGANSWNAATDGVVGLVGPPLGGVLFAWAGFEVLVALDVVSYLVSAVAISLTRTRSAASGERSGFLAGVEALRKLPLARVLLPLGAVFLAANAALTALLVPFGVRHLGGSAQVGFVLSALGVGFLGGAVLVRWLDGVQPRTTLAVAQLCTAAGFAGLFSARELWGAMVAAVVIGVFGSVTVVTPRTAVQRLTPNHLLGRISALFLVAEAVATLVGAIAGPWLAEAVSLHVAAMVAAGTTAVGAVVGAVTVPRVMLAAKRSNEQADTHA